MIVGLSAYAVDAAFGVWQVPAVLVPRSYVEKVVAAGGVPVLLPPLPGLVEAVLPRLDALIVVGGPDVDPTRYGQERGEHVQPPSLERDAAESNLLVEALDAGLPVLGICRGLQVLNVLRGGTLIQHLPDVLGHEEHSPAPGVYGSHPVQVEPGSRLDDTMPAAAREAVPSYHHQAIDELGKGLVVSAWASDGTIEAVEDPSLPYFVAVQWHPEIGEDVSLFAGLVEAARARRS